MLGSTDIVAFVAITNAEKARGFYEGILGLRFVKDDGFALVFEANGIMVRAAKMKDFKPAQYTVLGWQVSRIDDAVRSLTNLGVKFEIFGFFKQDELGIWTAPTGDKVAWFKDPDGNILSISQHV
jgi:catechol 2,3-dioxygenase-like lactoylglutathione lyase family enzyme